MPNAKERIRPGDCSRPDAAEQEESRRTGSGRQGSCFYKAGEERLVLLLLPIDNAEMRRGAAKNLREKREEADGLVPTCK